jgi:hypothetical protein
MTAPLTQGEAVIFLDHYDLFDIDMKGKECMFYKYTMDDKCLVLDPMSEEWAEPKVSMLEQKKPGHVPKKYANLCKTIRTMVVSC